MSVSIIAFGWIDPPMLGWLAAAAAPLLIQLLAKRRYRKTNWAAMDILRAAVRRRSRSVRFEQWLLTAVRTLLIVLVVAAVAGPYFAADEQTATTGRGIHHIMVLDDSFSMAYKSDGQTRFERAKELARRIVADGSSNDAFSLVLMARRPHTVINVSLDREAVLRELDHVRPSEEKGDLPSTVADIERLINDAKRQTSQHVEPLVYFITDLQRTTWSPTLTGRAKNEFLRQSNELAGRASVALLDVGEPDADNLAVVDFRPVGRPVVVGGSVSLRAELKNFGPRNRLKQGVELMIDGRRIARREVDIAAGQSAAVEFSHTFDSPGDYRLEIVAPGDALPTDDRRFLALSVPRSIRILCIDGRPSGNRFDSAASYLSLALASREGLSNAARIDVEATDEQALLNRNLVDYDCLFLCNVARFTKDEAHALGNYLRGGGGAVFFLGDQAEVENYNRQLGRPEREATAAWAGEDILPARLTTIVAEPLYRLDPLDFRHPIVRAFRGRGRKGLITTPVFKYFRLAPLGNEATVALAAENGNPLIVERRVGQGRVVMAATSAEPSWSALPLWPSFAPLVHEIVAFCAAERFQGQNVVVDDSVDFTLPASCVGGTATVETPDGRELAVRPRPVGGCAVLECRNNYASGFYVVRLDAAEQRRLYAVNVDRSESNLARVGLDELHAELWPEVAVRDRVAVSGVDARTDDMPVALLYCVLGLLIADSLLSWKLGRT